MTHQHQIILECFRMAEAYTVLSQKDASLANDVWEILSGPMNAKLAATAHLESYMLDDFFPRRHSGCFLPFQTVADRLQEICDQVDEKINEANEQYHLDLKAREKTEWAA